MLVLVAAATAIGAMLLAGAGAAGAQEAPVELRVPGQVEAEDFDAGESGVAYSDTDPSVGNRRTDVAVDVWEFDQEWDGASGALIGRTRDGEFLEYTVTVAEPATFDVRLSVASGSESPGVIHVDIDGERLGTVSGDTDRWFDWSARSAGTVELPAGTSTVRLTWDDGANVNLDWFDMRPVGPQSPTCESGEQEAESARVAGRFRTIEDDAASGAAYVDVQRGTRGWLNGVSDSFVEFCFGVSEPGSYHIEADVRAPTLLDNSFFVNVNSGELVDFIIEPNDDFVATLVNDAAALDPVAAGDSDESVIDPVTWDLEAGDHIVRFYLRRDGTELDRVRLVNQVPFVSALAGPEQASGPTLELDASASSPDGLAQITVLRNGETVAQEDLADTPTNYAETITLDTSEFLNGAAEYQLIVTNVVGDVSETDVIVIRTLNPLGPEGPSSVVTLQAPLTLDELRLLLQDLDQQVVEYRDDRVLAAPPESPARVVAAAEALGIEVVPGPTAVQGGFYGRGMSLNDQIATYRALAGDLGFEPQITAIRFDGALTPETEAALAAVIDTSFDFIPGDAADPADPSEPSVPGAAAQVGAAQIAEGQLGPNAEARAAKANRADPPDVDNAVFWPTVGQVDTVELVVEIERDFWFDSTEEWVRFEHDMLWSPGVVQSFEDLNLAYEHDFKILTDRSILGTRPLCVLPIFATWDDLFYAYREDGVLWGSNFPDDADPYFDTDVSDACDQQDVSFGIRKPEVLDDGLGDNQAVVYRFEVALRKGGPDEGEFQHFAQRLSRLGDAACAIIGTQNCTGLDADAPNSASGAILRSAGQAIPGITLPACYSWQWPPDPNQLNNQQATRCAGDRDGDGWDDTVDCAPNDPAINPGAVDIPNDGIDQDCDGEDLVVGSGALQFTLIWDNDNDQDLWVIEPDGTRISYLNRGPTASGGKLDRDDNVGVCGADATPGGVENVFWDETAPIGTFEVVIDEFGSCGTPANWVVEVRQDEDLVERVEGIGSGSFSFELE